MHRITPFFCPNCEGLLEAYLQLPFSSGELDKPLQEGEVSVCFHCAVLLERVGDGWRHMEQEEVYNLDPVVREKVLYAQERARAFIERNQR